MLGYYLLNTFGKLCMWIDVFEQVDILEKIRIGLQYFFKTTVLASISGLNYRFWKFLNNIGHWDFVLSWVRTTTTTYIQTEIFKTTFWTQRTVNVSTANSKSFSITTLSLNLYRWGSETNATNISSLHETQHLKSHHHSLYNIPLKNSIC